MILSYHCIYGVIRMYVSFPTGPVCAPRKEEHLALLRDIEHPSWPGTLKVIISSSYKSQELHRLLKATSQGALIPQCSSSLWWNARNCWKLGKASDPFLRPFWWETIGLLTEKPLNPTSASSHACLPEGRGYSLLVFPLRCSVACGQSLPSNVKMENS